MTAPTSGSSANAGAGYASSTEWPFLSVIVPCRNEARYIGNCLESIFANDYPPQRLEVLVVDGRSDDDTRAIVERYARRHQSLRLLDNPKRITPSALNTAIKAARGEIIARLDAHAMYPPTYLSQLVHVLEESGADSVGGTIKTLPGDDTPVARAIAIAMSHRFGVGNSHFRIGSSGPRYVDHVPFFCCRRELFERIGTFDEELVRNQDGEFSSRLIRRGGRILLVPSISAYYYARDSLAKLGRMFFQYGYFKPLTARKVGRIMTARQLAPAVFLTSLALASLLSLWMPAMGGVAAGIAGAYITLVIGCAAGASRRHGVTIALRLLVVFPIQHVAYGWGFLRRSIELAVGSRTPPSARSVALSR